MVLRDLGQIRLHAANRKRGILRCGLVLISLILILVPRSFPQTQSPQRRALLQRKGELLKSIKDYQQKQAEAQATLDQGAALRQRAEAAGDSKNAGIASQAMDEATQAIATARRYETEDRQRLEAINVALGWPDSDKPRAVATLARGEIFRVNASGARVRFDPTTPVQLGDRVSVDQGFLELQLDDGSQMHLGPHTEFSYERDVQGVYYELFHGVLHKVTMVIGVRGATDQPRYRGLQAVAAVRGTEFTLEVNSLQEVFSVFEGEIEVDPGVGRDKVSVKAGQRLAVSKSGPIQAPTTFDPQAVSRWWQQ